MTDKEFLRDLAERLMHIPVMFGTDSDDADRLLRIARALPDEKLPPATDDTDGGSD